MKNQPWRRKRARERQKERQKARQCAYMLEASLSLSLSLPLSPSLSLSRLEVVRSDAGEGADAHAGARVVVLLLVQQHEVDDHVLYEKKVSVCWEVRS
jgi:hypothetical protein